MRFKPRTGCFSCLNTVLEEIYRSICRLKTTLMRIEQGCTYVKSYLQLKICIREESYFEIWSLITLCLISLGMQNWLILGFRRKGLLRQILKTDWQSHFVGAMLIWLLKWFENKGMVSQLTGIYWVFWFLSFLREFLLITTMTKIPCFQTFWTMKLRYLRM